MFGLCPKSGDLTLRCSICKIHKRPSLVAQILILISFSEVVVAKGAVLKSLRGEIITRRFRRRNFGVVEDIPLVCFPDHRRSTLKAVRDIEDNELRVRNRMVMIFRNVSTCFFILKSLLHQPSDRMQRGEYSERSIRVHQGWNSMPLVGPMRFRVILVSSPHELEQYADILNPSTGMSIRSANGDRPS